MHMMSFYLVERFKEVESGKEHLVNFIVDNWSDSFLKIGTEIIKITMLPSLNDTMEYIPCNFLALYVLFACNCSLSYSLRNAECRNG